MKTSFTIKYDGLALQNHEMDVALLAPALMAMSHLVKEISLLQSNGEYSAQLSVKGNIKAGSIEIELVTQAISILQQVKDMFNNDTSTAIANFGGIVGVLAGVYHLIAKYKGKSPNNIEHDDEQVILYFDDRKEIVNHHIYKIYINYDLREDIYKTVEPLETDGVDTFKILQSEKELFSAHESDISSFIPQKINVQLNENLQETILIIESLTFKEGNKWTFYDGSNSIKAAILDEDFLATIEKGRRFAKGDWLKVQLRKIQHEENGKLKTTYDIVKVLEHIVKDQPDLF